jgi:2-iminobutanoate/2-iminopropanoate deaminase
MNRKIINPTELPPLNSTYSQAIVANGFVFVAGQIGLDPATGELVSDDIAEQTRQALENTITVLRAAGSCIEKVVSVSLYLTQFDELSRVNAVYGQYFRKNGPAKFACGVAQLYGRAEVEIQVVASA